jgi:putative acetyltransferase
MQRLMSPSLSQTPVRVALTDDWSTVRMLWREYAGAQNVDLCFQGFEAELAGLPGRFATPTGGVWLAWLGHEIAGCVAMRPLQTANYANACEMKRLYVRPALRGRGVGRTLSEHVMQSAQLTGYRHVLLDTLNDMQAARALYADLGFCEIEPYDANPIPGAHHLLATLK